MKNSSGLQSAVFATRILLCTKVTNTAFRRHISQKHKNEFSTQRKLTKGDRKRIIAKCVKYVAKGLRPFKAIQYEALNELVQVGHSDISLPCRQTVTTYTHRYCDVGQKRLVDFLDMALGPISITTEMWTNKKVDCLMGVTAHFLSKTDFVRYDVMLDLCQTTERSTSDALWRQLRDILHRFRIQHKIRSVTTITAQLS